MSEPETTVHEETEWITYRHRERAKDDTKPDIEYEVEEEAGCPVRHKSDKGDDLLMNRVYFRIRTIRNLLNKEEVHQPAYTYMPAEGFLSVYERVEG